MFYIVYNACVYAVVHTNTYIDPTSEPSDVPTLEPSDKPTLSPTMEPTVEPTPCFFDNMTIPCHLLYFNTTSNDTGIVKQRSKGMYNI